MTRIEIRYSRIEIVKHFYDSRSLFSTLDFKELWAFLTDLTQKNTTAPILTGMLFKRIVGYFKPQWKRLSVVALLTLVDCRGGVAAAHHRFTRGGPAQGRPGTVGDAGGGRRGAGDRAVDLVLQLGIAALDGGDHR